MHVRTGTGTGRRLLRVGPILAYQGGNYGDVARNDLSFVRVGRFDGELWAGKVSGRFGVFIDDRASEAQAAALPIIFGGRAGGFPAQVNALFADGRECVGIEHASISFDIAPDQSLWGVDIAGKVQAWAEAWTGPASKPGDYLRLSGAPGSETGPG